MQYRMSEQQYYAECGVVAPGMTELGVRKWFTFVGSFIEMLAIACFGVSKTPAAASLWYSMMKVG